MSVAQYLRMIAKLPRTLSVVIVVLVFGIFLTCLNVYELRRMQQEHLELDRTVLSSSKCSNSPSNCGSKNRILWVKAEEAQSGYLNHVFNVFLRLGFTIEFEKPEAWDVLWHHNYPFLDQDMQPLFSDLLPHQRVNHIPGSGFYTSKVNLATSNVSGIPQAYKLPEQESELLREARKHPDTFWVQKSNRHRGIVIKTVKELDLSQNESFVQRYVSEPLLIDSRKFDIGLYTLITSLRPLRAYVYDGEALLRFCSKSYHPFSAKDTDKYVVGDDYTPTWEVPALSQYYKDFGFSHKESLNAYLRSLGKSPKKVWRRLYDTIREVLRSKETSFLDLISEYRNGGRNFFELSRFDFVLDENMNVYLMEANMSPNLSSEHFPANRLLYEQVLFNLVSILGLSARVQDPGWIGEGRNDETEMFVSDRDLAVFPEHCGLPECSSCSIPGCKLCSKCLSTDLRTMLRDAYLEHQNRQNMRRLVPEPLIYSDVISGKDEKAFDQFLSTLPSEEDKILALWLRGKCLQNRTWCE